MFTLQNPNQASINVTGRCNSLCAYCLYSKQDRQSDGPTSSELTDLIAQLATMGVKMISLSGGEPLLRDDIHHLINYGSNQGMEITLITNMTLLTLKKMSQLADAGLHTLVVSLDTLDPKTYLELRGMPLDVPIRRFHRLQDFRRETAKIPLVIVNMVLSPMLIDRIVSDINILSSWLLPQDRIIIQPYQEIPGTDYKTKFPDHSVFSEPQLQHLVYTLEEKRCSGMPIGNTTSFLKIMPDLIFKRVNPDHYQCTVGFQALFINENLDVLPCWRLPAICNLRETSLIEIWCSQTYREARQRMVALNCPKCSFICHSPDMIAALIHEHKSRNTH